MAGWTRPYRWQVDFLPPESVVYIRKDASGEREEITVEDDPESTDAPSPCW